MPHNSTYAAVAVILIAGSIRRTERGIIDELEAGGAVTPEQAIPLGLSFWFRKAIFRRLLNGGAVGETQEMKQYLEVVGYAHFRARRRKRALIVLGIAVVILALAYFRLLPFLPAPTP